MKPYKQHILVCHGKTCSAAGSERLLELLRDKLDAEGLSGEIKTSKGGCFSVCKETEPKGGYCPVVVIYPHGVWYRNVSEKDIHEIVEKHIKGGRIIERLLHYKMQPP